MKTNLTKYKDDLKTLIKEGNKLLKILDEGENKYLLDFRNKYEIWYSEALRLVQILLPQREVDFKDYYNNKKGDCLKSAIVYTPPNSELDFSLEALEIDIAKSLFINQLGIIKSIEKIFESSLFDIKQVMQADLFDNELEAASMLVKKGLYMI